MAKSWGDFFESTAQDAIRGFLGVGKSSKGRGKLPAAVNLPTYGFAPTTTPREVTVDTATGEVKPCRRRRRRRLLTPTDLSDLAALQALVGKGSSALNMAVAKAVRR